MTDSDLDILIRISGNLEGISVALHESMPHIATWLCDMTEWLEGIIERCKNGT